MRKIAAALLFAALLAPATVHAVGPDGGEGFLRRIATYLGLRSNGPSSPAASPARTAGGRRSLDGRTPEGGQPTCTCVTPTGLVAGYVAPDGSCQLAPPPDRQQDYQMP